MKDVQISECGRLEMLILEEAPQPQRADDEVLVRVYAAGVKPVDVKTRADGSLAGRYGQTFPLILGWDGSGVVEAAGNDVTGFSPDDQVY